MKLLYLSLIVFVFTDCSDYSKNATNRDSTLVDSVFTSDSVLFDKFDFINDTSLIDTLIVDPYKLIISTITKDEFINSIKNYNGYSDETFYFNNFIEHLDKNVKRDGEILTFDLKNGKKAKLTNQSPGDDGFSYSDYKYISHFPFMNSYLVAGKFYELWNCILVNDSIGDIYRDLLFHYVSIEPQNKRMITYYWDEWALKSGGFKIFDIKNGKTELIVSYLIDGPTVNDYCCSLSNVYFIRQNELVFIRQFYKNTVRPFKYMKCFSKMTITK